MNYVKFCKNYPGSKLPPPAVAGVRVNLSQVVLKRLEKSQKKAMSYEWLQGIAGIYTHKPELHVHKSSQLQDSDHDIALNVNFL